MKNKDMRSLSVLSVLVMLFLGFSCVEHGVKEVFPESSTQRLSKRVEAVRNELLASSEGWKVVYSPVPEKLGNFTFLMRFIDERTVEMVSDFDILVAPPTRSEYRLTLGSSVKLSFVTRNAIHALSNSADRPSADFRNRGYEGDFEFIYYGKDGEDLLFRGNRHKDKNQAKGNPEVRFKKATAQDWVDMDAIKKSPGLYKIVGRPFLSPMERMSLQTGAGAGVLYTRTSPSLLTRLLDWKEINDAGDFGQGSTSFRILSFTPQGFITSPLMVGNVPLSEFVYNKDDDNFVATNGGETAVLSNGLLSDPALFINVQNDGKGFKKFVYFYEETFLGSNMAPENSSAFLDLMTDVANKLYSEKEITFYRFDIRFNRLVEKDGVLGLHHYIYFYLKDKEGNRTYPRHYFTFSIDEDNKIVMVHDSWSIYGFEYKKYVKPISDVFIQDEGLYMKETPRFTKYSNRIFAFQSQRDQSLIAGGFYSFKY